MNIMRRTSRLLALFVVVLISLPFLVVLSVGYAITQGILKWIESISDFFAVVSRMLFVAWRGKQ